VHDSSVVEGVAAVGFDAEGDRVVFYGAFVVSFAAVGVAALAKYLRRGGFYGSAAE